MEFMDLTELFTDYEDQWVALTDDNTVIATGKTLERVASLLCISLFFLDFSSCISDGSALSGLCGSEIRLLPGIWDLRWPS